MCPNSYSALHDYLLDDRARDEGEARRAPFLMLELRAEALTARFEEAFLPRLGALCCFVVPTVCPTVGQAGAAAFVREAERPSIPPLARADWRFCLLVCFDVSPLGILPSIVSRGVADHSCEQ